MVVTTQDWIALAVGILGIVLPLLTAWLKERTKPPVWLQEWLDTVGRGDTVRARLTYLVKAAESFSEKDNEQRKDYVKQSLIRWLVASNINIPDSVVNLLIEWVYQTYKRKLVKS